MLNLLTSVTAWEREQGGERTRAALMELKARRRCYGTIPVELRDSGERDADGRRVLASNADGAATLEQIRQLRAGGASLRQIAGALTSARPPHGARRQVERRDRAHHPRAYKPALTSAPAP
jgi:hypothetical protein